MESLKAVHAQAMSVEYLENQPELSSWERDILGVAHCDHDSFFEVTDMGASDCTLPTSFRIRLLDRNAVDVFEEASRKLKSSILDRHRTEFLSQCPGLDFPLLSQVISSETGAITDFNAMTGKLITAMSQHVLEADLMLLFCVTWVLLYNLGEAHEQWIRNGYPSLLTAEDLESLGHHDFHDFIHSNLKRLEGREVNLKVDEAGAENISKVPFLASYLPDDRTLVFSGKFVASLKRNPHPSSVPSNAGALLAHEFFHVSQNAGEKAQGAMGQIEAPAEIFGTKVQILLQGAEPARKAMEEAQRKEWQICDEIRQDTDAASPFQLLMDYVKNGGLIHSSIRLLEWDIALFELTTGGSDPRRQDFEQQYVFSRLMGDNIRRLFLSYDESFTRLKNLRDNLDPEDRLLARSSLAAKYAVLPELDSLFLEWHLHDIQPDSIEFKDRLFDYMDEITLKLYYHWLLHGPQDAALLFKTQYLPLMEGPILSYWLMMSYTSIEW